MAMNGPEFRTASRQRLEEAADVDGVQHVAYLRTFSFERHRSLRLERRCSSVTKGRTGLGLSVAGDKGHRIQVAVELGPGALWDVVPGVGDARNVTIAGPSRSRGPFGEEVTPIQERAHLPMQMAVETLVVDQGDDLPSFHRLPRHHAEVINVPVDGVDRASVGEQVLRDENLPFGPGVQRLDGDAVADGMDRIASCPVPKDLLSTIEGEEVHACVIELAEGYCVTIVIAETVRAIAKGRILCPEAGIDDVRSSEAVNIGSVALVRLQRVVEGLG